MFFLIRVAFWLSIVVLLLPTGKAQQTVQASQFGAADALSAAGAAVSDMRQFCARQPEACDVGSQAAVAFGQKAQASAKMIYDFLTEQLAVDEGGASKNKTANAAMRSGKAAQDTLRPGDRTPAWRGPQPEQARRAPVRGTPPAASDAG
ncbi:MAG TPA: DUF5330 domain-containing protein [Xanthobacteraceae bacterium]|nr:DUF5330 domain-containing protein [Xanthobacteraceae bacterium]